ncbi:MAG TPA: UvrD-helicase domain-containing protein [Rudaea sp.]|nr:UvrD-helicase domain-containing protein [Rudaea sp.]
MSHDALPPLDWPTVPLTGRVLIEASAGTGKTHTIGLIFLRLLLERGLRIEQILVATFTDRAAQELRERLRLRLVEAERALQFQIHDDPRLIEWLAKLCPDASSRERASRRLQLARADIDRAPIGTIHALCRRILRDYPLESGAPMLADTLLDQNALLRECIEDFWRRRFFGERADDEEVRVVAEKGIDDLFRDVCTLVDVDANVLPIDVASSVRDDMLFIRRIEHVTILRDICADASLFSTKKKGALRSRLLDVAAAIETDDDIVAIVTDKTAACIESITIAEHLSPSGNLVLVEHDVIVALQRIRASAKSHKRSVRGRVIADAVEFCRNEIPKRARARDAQTFSMLIAAVHARLNTQRVGAAFAEKLFDAFPAALIDEFQDTDHRQFDIFDGIYRDGEGRSRGLLAVIGDPKQAIYGFRGGDIAEYLRARKQSSHRFALTVNHRSTEPLVAAINALYANSSGGFASEDISYPVAEAAGRVDAKPFCHDGIVIERPFTIHRFADDNTSATHLDSRATEDSADRIVEVLNDARYTMGSRRVMPGDIAVLVPMNAEVDAMRRCLTARGVPCAGSGRGNVLREPVARDLELVLHAVLDVEDENALRGALCTKLLGATLRDVQRWREDASSFDREVERFAAWRDIARSRGVAALVETIAADRAASLLGHEEGERWLTDLRHIGELIACDRDASQGLESACARLSKWRVATVGDSVEVAQARRPRLSSDVPGVQLLTLHAAKGLQFPIVFLPFAWRVRGRNVPNVLRFHEPDGALCFDVGSPLFDENLARYLDGDLQERLRLLYVGMTRAEYAVHAYWTDRNGEPAFGENASGTAALDILLHAAFSHAGLPSKDASLDALATVVEGLQIVGPCSAHARFKPVVTEPAQREARTPLPATRPPLWLHSFSSIARHAALDIAMTPAADENETDIDDSRETGVLDEAQSFDDPILLSLDAWRGRYFGNAVHTILEEAADGDVWPSQRDLVTRYTRSLISRGGSDSIEPIGRMVDRVRNTDLVDGLRLIDVPRDHAISEFEFQFAVTHTTLDALREACLRFGCGDAISPALSGATLNGMLTGFADLIFRHNGRFHVLDYKTNWLGNRLSDYDASSLDTAMAEHHYALQALLYTVALHRYLRGRLDGYSPERHLGDSWYLFVRAIGIVPGAGVWRRRWPVGLIEAIDDVFAGETA